MNMRSLKQASPAVHHQLQEAEKKRRVKQSFILGSVNGCMLILILYDLAYSNRVYGSTVHNVEIAISAILVFNMVFHIGRVIWTKMRITLPFSSMEVTKLSNQSEDQGQVQEEFSCYQRANWEIITGEEISDPNKFFSGNYMSTSSTHLSLKHKGDVLTLKDLKRYLRDYEEAEKSSFIASSVESQSILINQFWNNSSPLTPMEVSPILRRTVYQISPISHNSSDSSGHSSSEEGGSPIVHMNTEFWRKHKGIQYNFVNWISSLRMWIACTVMQRLVEEIEVVNNGLKNQGLVGISVGSVGLDTLTNTAQNIIVAHNIPTLPFLIPFLQVSSNQQYVVQRIKELAIGTSMSEYNWKGGGKVNDKEWEPPLPTDAELVMHMVRSYLDSQLPLLPCEPDARPFTTQYFAKAPNKPRQTGIAIYQHTGTPPHYHLIVNDEIQEIPQGRNNLFYTILLFLLHIDTEYHGMLGRINLGPPGLNMLWIIERTNY